MNNVIYYMSARNEGRETVLENWTTDEIKNEKILVNNFETQSTKVKEAKINSSEKDFKFTLRVSLIYHFLESLILAQDERWRRA